MLALGKGIMRSTLLIVVSLFATVLSLVLASSPSAKKQKPIPCSDRYVVTQGAAAIVTDSAPDAPVVSVQGKQVSLGAHCGPATGVVKATKKGTNVAAGFKSCGDTLKKVKLKALIAADCASMSGVVKAKKLKPQRFQASISRCGDGVVDRGKPEACDGAVGCQAGATCTPDCTACAAPVKGAFTCITSGAACNHMTDCPIQPRAGQPGEGCCGDGVPDGPVNGETCDLGKDQNCASLPCSTGCTAQCRSVGTCTQGGSQCVANADCGGTGTCCGNHFVDPGETCDDGNTVDGAPTETSPFALDGCPANCHKDSCTASTSTLATSITFTGPAGVTIAGLGTLVDYPEGKVTLTSPDTDITKGFGVTSAIDDEGYAFVAESLKVSGLPTPVLHANFKTCQGAAAASASDFKCTVTDAADDQGNVVPASQMTCAVTIP